MVIKLNSSGILWGLVHCNILSQILHPSALGSMIITNYSLLFNFETFYKEIFPNSWDFTFVDASKYNEITKMTICTDKLELILQTIKQQITRE